MIDVRSICTDVAKRHGLLPKQVYYAFRFHQRYVVKMIRVNSKPFCLPKDFSLESQPMSKEEFKNLYPDIILHNFAKLAVYYSTYLIWFNQKKKSLSNRIRHKEVYSGIRTHMTSGYYKRLYYYKKKYEECENPDKIMRMRKRYINALKAIEKRRELVKETVNKKKELYDKQHCKGNSGQENTAAVHEDSDNS